MDGQFVPNLAMSAVVVESVRKVTDLTLDVHMMVERAERFAVDFARAGADIYSIHAEATPHLHGALQTVKATGMKAGVVINPGTPVAMIEPVLHLVDQVLVMTVNPGFGGQKFLPECISKVEKIAALRDEFGFDFDIEVDGGVDDTNILTLKNAGANVFVAGSYIYGAEHPEEQIKKLQQELEKIND
jgi:ribulose-phosphate 3-epimerase